MRLTAVSAFFGILIAVVCSASSALAVSTGGVSAGGAPTTTPASTPAPVHTDPVTQKTPNDAYSGPVYEKLSDGEVVPYVASATSTTTTASTATTTAASPTTGGVEMVGTSAPTSVPVAVGGPTPKPELLVPGTRARFVNGLAAAPESVPAVVQEIIWAANEIVGLPYIYGGGHASFISPGYDCSGTVSFALHGGGLLASPEDSGEMETWGSHGAGRYVTIFANGGHAYMTVAGLRLDTSSADDPSNLQGPRWRPLRQGNEGYVVRHPLGL